MEPDSILSLSNQATGEVLIGTINPSLIIGCVVLIILLIFSALISGSEVAFFSLSPSHKEEIRNKAGKSHHFIQKLIKTREKLLATILVANNFINVAIIILSTYLVHSIFNFSSFPVLGFLIEVIVITFILLLFGEIVPKIYASNYGLQFARLMAIPLYYTQKSLSPFVFFLTSSTSFLSKHKNRFNSNISVNELIEALELTDEEELSDDRTILKGIVRFGTTNVDQVMTPRIDVVAVDIETTMAKLINIINMNGYSRIPVYSESFDNVSGILYIKDLLPHYHELDNFKWQNIIRPPYFVPENKKIDDLLEEFQKYKVHMAIVVDEYGGTSGIITLEDILEEIVGDIADEFDDDDNNLFSRINQNTYLFDGKIPLIDFYRVCDLDSEMFKKAKGDADTLAGLILELKGEFPKPNEVINFEFLSFFIEALDKRRIKKIRVTINKQA